MVGLEFTQDSEQCSTLYNRMVHHTKILRGTTHALPEVEELPVLWNSGEDRVYLDTTYCSPQYGEVDVVARAVEVAMVNTEASVVVLLT